MKFPKKEILAAVVLCFCLPPLLAKLFVSNAGKADISDITETTKKIKITLCSDSGELLVMPLEEYLVGVLLAEMPMSFHNEAFRAQAVAARTVALRLMKDGNKHKAGDICTNSGCCQGYMAPDEYLNKGGNLESIDKARLAVADTENIVIYYNGELIEATYFSCSGGRTEDAVAVWGSDVPYLQAVDSPGEEDANYYTETKTISAEQFCNKLSLDGSKRLTIENAAYTDGGSVDSIIISGKRFTGIQLRNTLNLKSTNFTIEIIGDRVKITTRGFGHRVGMSQYGADAMGRRGCTYVEILTHYYTGVQVREYDW